MIRELKILKKQGAIEVEGRPLRSCAEMVARGLAKYSEFKRKFDGKWWNVRSINITDAGRKYLEEHSS